MFIVYVKHMKSGELKIRAANLRMLGHSYEQICHQLGCVIPKSTLSTWFKGIVLTESAQQKIRERNLKHLSSARKEAIIVKARARDVYFSGLREKNSQLSRRLVEDEVAKIALGMLYLGEGSKSKGIAGVGFGNADPEVITLFLNLLRKCYSLDESKFRCTVQCRADQDIPALEQFWSGVTGIPLNQFYTSRVDSRTAGKTSRNKNYKGVCRLNYFSASVFHDIMSVIEILKGR